MNPTIENRIQYVVIRALLCSSSPPFLSFLLLVRPLDAADREAAARCLFSAARALPLRHVQLQLQALSARRCPPQGLAGQMQGRPAAGPSAARPLGAPKTKKSSSS